MSDSIDPAARAFQAEGAEHVAVPERPGRPVPPESYQAEDAEHLGVTQFGPADSGAPPSS